MSEISFSTKPQSKVIREDRDWYRSYCNKCPYFVNDEIFKIVRCERPNEKCFADGLLVAGLIMTERHNEMIKKLYEKKSEPIVGEATLKRRAKIIRKKR